MTSILDSYIKSAPSAQNAVDLFKGEWSSILPEGVGADTGGSGLFFEDARLAWFLQQICGVGGRSVLELGPLEGGHTWMCERAGAKSILSIEANTRAYLKCLVVSQVTAMKYANFVLGDFIEYLKVDGPVFDVGLASGVLYHMREPAELIQLLSRRCREVFFWTHYHDEERARTDPVLAKMLSEPEELKHAGFRYRAVRKRYGEALGWQGFCGGSAEFARWMPRDDMMRAMEHFGFEVMGTAFEQPDHPNGPSMAFWARNRNAL